MCCLLVAAWRLAGVFSSPRLGRDLLLWILDLLIVPAVGLGEAGEFSPVAFSISRRNSRLGTPGCGMSFLPIGSLWVLVV